MKKNVCLIILFAILIGINSCQKDEFGTNETDVKFEVEDAKTWIESLHSEEFQFKSGNIEGTKKKYKPEWKHAFTSNYDKVEVVETYIASTGSFGFASSESFEEWNT